MKNKFKIAMVYIVSLIPISSISMAATSKYYTLKDKENMEKLKVDSYKLKSMIWSRMKTNVTYEEAYANFTSRTSLKNQQKVDIEFERILEVLANEGLIKLNEDNIMSPAPSLSS